MKSKEAEASNILAADQKLDAEQKKAEGKKSLYFASYFLFYSAFKNKYEDFTVLILLFMIGFLF